MSPFLIFQPLFHIISQVTTFHLQWPTSSVRIKNYKFKIHYSPQRCHQTVNDGCCNIDLTHQQRTIVGKEKQTMKKIKYPS